MMRSSVVVGLVMVVGGCVAEVGEEATSTTEQGLKCPDYGCGENSPVGGPFNIRELNKAGNIANSDGVTLLYFQKGTTIYHVDIAGDRVRALTWFGYQVALEHSALAGGYFVLSHPAVNGLPAGTMRLFITSVDVAGQTFWLGPQTQVESYELKYDGAGTVSDPVPACKTPLPGTGIRDTALDPEGRTWKNRFNAIIFAGDRYRQGHVVETGTSTNGWFNIACAGSGPAKLHLNRHTAASTTYGFTSTVAQRQAMLRMYAGDFCGDGNAHTVMGTPIRWWSAVGQSSMPIGEFSYESMWSETGAMCMDVHRLSNSTNPDYAAFGQAIIDSCHIRKCAEFPDFKNFALYNQYLLTMSPAH